MRFFLLVFGATIFVTIAISENPYLNDSPDLSAFQDLPQDLFASQDLPESSQLIDDGDDDADDFLFDDDNSDAMEAFSLETADSFSGLKPFCLTENEQLLNRLRSRDDERETCSTRDWVPLRDGSSFEDYPNLLQEPKDSFFSSEQNPERSEDSTCLTRFPYHLCCMELGVPLRMVTGEILPEEAVPVYKEALVCYEGM